MTSLIYDLFTFCNITISSAALTFGIKVIVRMIHCFVTISDSFFEVLMTNHEIIVLNR